VPPVCTYVSITGSDDDSEGTGIVELDDDAPIGELASVPMETKPDSGSRWSIDPLIGDHPGFASTNDEAATQSLITMLGGLPERKRPWSAARVRRHPALPPLGTG
jgi:hypothetical protein